MASTPRTFSFGTNSDGSKILTTTTVQASDPAFKEGTYTTFQGSVSTGGSATIVIQGSNDSTSYYGTPTTNNWITLGTITLTAGTLSDGFTTVAPWRAVRANVTAVTGTLRVRYQPG